MYNQRESLACIVITPALQAGGRGIVTLSAHHQPTENTSARFHLIACSAQAGGHFVRQNSGKLPKNCQGKENPQGPAGHASYGAGVCPADRPGYCADETPAGSASRQQYASVGEGRGPVPDQSSGEVSANPIGVTPARIKAHTGSNQSARWHQFLLPQGTHVGHAGGAA